MSKSRPNNDRKVINDELARLHLPKGEISKRTDRIQINDYIIFDQLGIGTYGRVFLGEHILIKENVGIKILEKAKIVESSDVENIKREIISLQMLRHPYILQLYETIETTLNIYLIIEYANQGTLFSHIVSNNKINERNGCNYFLMLVEAVKYCHSRNIIHRDLKPENILLNSDNHVISLKLTDFGLCNFSNPETFLYTNCGSPCYIPPEVLIGQKYDGRQADIWSLGIILYTMLCGSLPFDNDNPKVVYRLIDQNMYARPSYLSSCCLDLIEKILKKNPVERLPMEGILEHDWCKQVEQYKFGNYEVESEGDINTEVMEQLLEHNVNTDIVRMHLLKKSVDSYTSLYYLQERKNRKSIVVNKITLPKIITNSNSNPEIFGTSPDSIKVINRNGSVSNISKLLSGDGNNNRASFQDMATKKRKMDSPNRKLISRSPYSFKDNLITTHKSWAVKKINNIIKLYNNKEKKELANLISNLSNSITMHINQIDESNYSCEYKGVLIDIQVTEEELYNINKGCIKVTKILGDYTTFYDFIITVIEGNNAY